MVNKIRKLFKKPTCLAIIIILTTTVWSVKPAQTVAFKNEKLFYRLTWKGITAGHAMYSRKKKKNFIELKGYIISNASGIFPIKDSFMTKTTFRYFPLVAEKKIKEGNYLRDYKAWFSHTKHSAYFSFHEYNGNSKILGFKNSNAKWVHLKDTYHNLPLGIRDGLSLFEKLLSATSIKAGQYTIFEDAYLYRVYIRHGKKENIITPAGNFLAQESIVTIKAGKSKKTRKRFHVFIAKHKPILLLVDIEFLGQLKAELTRVTSID